MPEQQETEHADVSIRGDKPRIVVGIQEGTEDQLGIRVDRGELAQTEIVQWLSSAAHGTVCDLVNLLNAAGEKAEELNAEAEINER